MTIWHLDVERVRLVGAQVRGLDPVELRALVEAAVSDALLSAPLPAGRAVKAFVRVETHALGDGTAIARAVAGGVSHAVKGPARG